MDVTNPAAGLRSFIGSIYGSGDVPRILLATAVMFGIPLVLYQMFGTPGMLLAVLIFIAFLARLPGVKMG